MWRKIKRKRANAVQIAEIRAQIFDGGSEKQIFNGQSDELLWEKFGKGRPEREIPRAHTQAVPTLSVWKK